MRQVQIDEFGTPDVLHVVDVADPVPAPGEVLLDVQSAGLNPVDYKMRDGSSGSVQSLTAADFPYVLGREAAGIVLEEVPGTDGSTRFSPGDLVFGMPALTPRSGCYGERAVLPAAELAKAPDGVDALALGGAALAGLTAWQATHALGQVQPDERVLVHGGSGGVGQWIVQLCVAAGAEVVSTASANNAERIASLGATPFDYAAGDFAAELDPFDLILDTVYFDTFERSLDALVPGGRIVVLPTLADTRPATERGIEVHVPLVSPNTAVLEEIGAMLADGRATAEVSQTWDLEQAPDAHRALQTGHTRGKMVFDLR